MSALVRGKGSSAKPGVVDLSTIKFDLPTYTSWSAITRSMLVDVMIFNLAAKKASFSSTNSDRSRKLPYPLYTAAASTHRSTLIPGRAIL